MALHVVDLPDKGWEDNREKEKFEFTFTDEKECFTYFKQLIKDHYRELKNLCLNNNDDLFGNNRTDCLLNFTEVPGRVELSFSNEYKDSFGKPYYVAIKNDVEDIKKLVNNKVCFKFTNATIWFIINVGKLNTEVIVERI